MKLKKFIEKLKRVAEKHGDDTEVVMADNISVINPVFVKKNHFNEKVVVITDEE
ncbi:MAG: hypothetical protein KAQ87_04810 [Candidatus Pacebacteria bacterium]|nr:hypothetical protein [Candidatus Paceibacterota bacterium]